MDTSLNGWEVLSTRDSRLKTGRVPGTDKFITMRDEVLPLFLAIEVDVNAKVIPISGGYGPDGYQYRQARAASGFSNHASGTAVDNRYDVFKPDRQQDASPAQIVAMHAILDKYKTSGGKRVLDWGGDWTPGSYCDPMHIEIGQYWAPGVGSPVTIADVRNVIARLRINADGTTNSVPPVPIGHLPMPLTGLSVFLSAPGRIQLQWDKGDATSWLISVNGHESMSLANHGAAWNLKGPTVVSVLPNNNGVYGIGQCRRVIVP